MSSDVIKVTLLFQRAPQFSPTEFQQLWKPWSPSNAQERAALAARVPALIRWSRSVPLNAEMPITDAQTGALDIVEEFWFGSEAAAAAFLGAEETRKWLWPQQESHLKEGAIQMVAGMAMIMWERPADPQPDAMKLLLFSVAREGMSATEFQEYWINNHWPLAFAAPGARERAQKVEFQRSGLDAFSGFATAPFHGGLGMSGDSLAAFMSGLDNSYYVDVLRPDEPRFSDLSKSSGIIGKEFVLFDPGAGSPN
ncbi:EthD domain-containing protein [Sphingobium sp.]|uniref:EthD domain-containing protein n=1 Tax=Sphingobium sp. TaxID=1912891 RepID=UPI0028BD1EA0|nr:EthD domain-containing protein [Sphingobium sp.]